MTSANPQDYLNTLLRIKQTASNLDSSLSTLKISIQYAKWFPASTGSAVSFSLHLTPSQNFTSFLFQIVLYIWYNHNRRKRRNVAVMTSIVGNVSEEFRNAYKEESWQWIHWQPCLW